MDYLKNVDKKYICELCSLVMRNPYQSDCGCRYCEDCLNKHSKCESCNENIESKIKDKAFNNEIKRVNVDCVCCEWNGSLHEYKDHYETNHVTTKPCDINSICPTCSQIINNSLQNQMNTDNNHLNVLLDIRELLKNSLNDKSIASVATLESTNKSQIDFVTDLYDTIKQDINYLTLNNENLRRELESSKSKIQQLESDIKSYSKIQVQSQLALATLEERVLNLENMSKNGVLLWKITNFRDKYLEAKAGRQTNIYSPVFYTCENGYKLCSRLYLNGDGAGRGKCISIFMVIMRGPHDILLKWPFNMKISFFLIERSTTGESKEILIQSCKPDINSSACAQPKSDMNTAFGIPCFYQLTDLLSNDTNFLYEDTLYIKIVVS